MILLNGKLVTPTIFPDGTSQVWKIDNIEEVNVITWRFEHEVELIHIAQLRDLLPEQHVTLNIPYLPYARQDKEIKNDLTFALKTFAYLVNRLNFCSVMTFDVHSNIAKKVIENLISYKPTQILRQVLGDYNCVCFPDNGAKERYDFDSMLKEEKKIIYGEKVRNQQTGLITSYELFTWNGFPYTIDCGDKILVIDDLCDGGATFELLGKKIYQYKRPSLYVSHGIFSKGTDHLREYYSKIYTTDSVIFNSKYCQDKDLIKYESAPPYRLLQN